MIAALRDVRRDGKERAAQCPAHDDIRASLSVGRGDDGRLLLCCHAGCTVDSILSAASLTLSDLHDNVHSSDRHIVATYHYHDEQGELLFQVIRFHPKDFRQRRPDGSGGWTWKLGDVRRVLYRLPHLKGRTEAFVVEGERDADSLHAQSLTATCNPGGAGKWRDDYARQLAAAGVQQVHVLPDNDPPGEAHARDVARSCHQAGLVVRVVPLVGLPAKGDVTDWLHTHTVDDLRAAVLGCPVFRPSDSVAAGFKLELTSIADLLAEGDTQIDWLVEDRIASGSVVLLAGKPKAGKSTLARALAYAIASGTAWLAWRTRRGPVWYLALEDQRTEVRRHFRALGAIGTEPLRVFFGEAGPNLIPELRARALEETPAAIIVDTLQRLLRVKDVNDYAGVTEATTPLITLARDTGAAVVLIHHAKKFGEGIDAILGSTALSASVDNVFLLSRADRYRTLSSVQRIGRDLEPLVVSMDATTGHVQAAGTKRHVDESEAAQRILDALREHAAPVTEAWVKRNVEGRQEDLVRALRLLLRQARIIRSGRGGKSDPYQYECAGSEGSQVPKVPEVPRKPDFPQGDLLQSTESPIATESIAGSDVERALSEERSGSRFPIYIGEPGNLKNLEERYVPPPLSSVRKEPPTNVGEEHEHNEERF